MNTWNDIEHGFGPVRATQYTTSDADQLAATLYKLFHGRYVKSDNGHVITLSDGTSLTIVLADGNASENACAYNRGIMRAHADRRIIERAHLQKNTNHAGTITSLSLILFYQGETMPATIRAAHADITTGTFATPHDKNKPLATIRVALTQTQINEWVNREQQALADMLAGETITSATDGVFTLAPREGDGNTTENVVMGENENVDEAVSAGDNVMRENGGTITAHATLNNQPRNNKGSRHATTITLTDGNTIAIRHETKEIDITSAEFGYIREECEYVDEGVTSRAAEAVKNGQAITAAWVEKREAYQPHTPYDEYDETPGETTETIELWVMFEGDLRPTRLTSNETEYTWRSMSPDFRLTRGEVTVHAASAHIEPDSTRPWR